MASTDLVPSLRNAVAVRPERVEAIRASINWRDRSNLGSFGDRAQRAAASFADKILSAATGKDLGDPDLILAAMLEKADGLDSGQLTKPGFFGRLLGNSKARLERFRIRFLDIASSIEQMAVEVERHKSNLRGDVAILEQLYEETVATLRDLDEHIEAATLEVAEMRDVKIPELRAQTPGEGSAAQLHAHEILEAEQCVDRLEKRVLQLQQARQIAFQQLPQIRIIQAGDETLIQNLEGAIDITIPAWKQKMVVLLGIARQGAALRLDKSIADTTGRLLTDTAKLLQQQAYAIEDRSQEGIVDVAAIEEANRILIETVSGVVTRQKEGRAKRQEAQRRIEVMRTDLESTLIAPRS